MSDINKQARVALEAIRALKLGQTHAFQSGRDTLFTIVMDHAPSATPTRLGKLVARVEAHGYRAAASSIHEATLRVDCVPSQKHIGPVTRIARDGDKTILMLAGTQNSGLWTIADYATADRRSLLLTAIGDDVVLWRDLDGEGKPGRVTMFRNRTLPPLD